jgi:hypothetical protein
MPSTSDLPIDIIVQLNNVHSSIIDLHTLYISEEYVKIFKGDNLNLFDRYIERMDIYIKRINKELKLLKKKRKRYK